VGDAAEAVRIAKWTAIILGGIVLLLIATVFVLTSVVDPNRYRGKIEGIVADLTGKPFVIEGDLAITWYPWLGVRTGPAHLGAPAIVEWQSINVAAKLWPLLHGEVVADRIRLQAPHIHLRRDAQGHGNWESVGSGPRTAAPTSGTAPTANGSATGRPSGTPPSAERPTAAQGARVQTSDTPAAASPKPSRPVQIAGIEIRDGTVDYVDEATGQQATLSNVDLDVGEWRADHPLPIHTRFLAHTQSLPPNGVWIELNAPELAVRPTPLSVSAPKLTLKVANAQAEGDFTYEQTAGNEQVTVAGTEATAASAQPTDATAGATAAGAQPSNAAAQANVADAQASDTRTDASGVQTRTADAHSLAADSRIRAHGTVTLHSPSLRELATDLALNQTLPHDPTTLGPLDLTTTWTYDNGSIAAKPLALKLDGVSFNGWLQRTAPPKSMWGFDLHGDRIDLSRYVKVDSKNKKPFELPVEALRAINANGSVIFDQLVFADTHMTDVRLKLQTPEGNP
jgi:AsmA protein